MLKTKAGRRGPTWAAAGALALALAACGGGDDKSNATGEAAGGAHGTSGAVTVTADDRAEAQALFVSTCSTCHGMQGKGDGVLAKTLDPKPRNYTDKNWQRSTSDAQIREIILKGGAGVGKNPMMPAQSQLMDKPGVVQALVEIVRKFGK